ncbi:helix-turn-helix transcriptional regulator [Skermanella aerolata]|nr:helix-turn-helix transcriptional regulator [Skermanella aerolata]
MRERYYTPESSPIFQSMLVGPVFEVIPREALSSDAAFAVMDYYNDVFRPQDLWHSIATCVNRSENEIVALGVARSKRAGIFGNRETLLVKTLAKHIRLATDVMARLGTLETDLANRESVLDRLHGALLLVNRAGRVLYANKAGVSVLGAGDGLALDGSRIQAARHTDTLRLLTMIQRAVVGGDEGLPPTPGSLSLPRPSGTRAYAITVYPLCQPGRWPAVPRAEAAIVIYDPGAIPQVPDQRLRQLYKLTPREIALAQAFVATCDLRVASDRLGISTNTAKTHLKNIFTKTSTASQAELIRLLMATGIQIR